MIILTHEQKIVVSGIINALKKGNEQIISLGGAAGCGKSTCLATLSQILPSYAICAYTGKAAQVLRKKGLDSSTIHSLIYKPFKDDEGTLEFVLKQRNELFIDGFLVDESSMLSEDLYGDLLSFSLPIIFIGDHGQLEPIGKDINVMANPMFKLETIHRNAGEIAFFADHIRKGGKPTKFKGGDKVKFVASSSVTDKMQAEVDQIICGFNRTRVEINNNVRNFLGKKELVEKGDRIICLRNSKPFGLFNGLQGIVDKVDLKKKKISFIADDLYYCDVKFNGNQWGKEKNQFEFGRDTPHPFDYAYAITCHKFQGSQCPKVMVYEQNCDLWDMKRWNYTAASRAEEELIWVSPSTYIPKWLK